MTSRVMRRIGFVAVLGTGAGLLATSASGVQALDGRLATAAAVQKQHEELRYRDAAFRDREPCERSRNQRPAAAGEEL